MGSDEHLCLPRIADDDISLFVSLDARSVEPGVGESVDDQPPDGLVLGRAIDTRYGERIDKDPEAFRCDGIEGVPDRFGHRLRSWGGGHEPHHDNSSRNSSNAAWKAAGSLM